MVLEKLSSSLKGTLSKIAKSIFVDEKLINELVKDIQRALLQSDINVQLVLELTKTIKERSLKEEPPKGITKREYIIKVVYEELVKFVGGQQQKIELTKKPFKIMLVGLFGSGKTTSSGKLARYFSKRGQKVAVIGLDIHRPAAMAQLEQVAKNADVDFYVDKELKDPIKILDKYQDKINNYDVLIYDTAGRDALSKELIKEIETVTKKIQPDESLLVLSADIGQTAQQQAEQFHTSCKISGVIVTKMDGTAKGGGALSACAVSKAPIKFIGVGEKLEDLEHFNPEGFIGRLLGMGDLESLLEKAKEAISEEEAEDLGKKFLGGDFNLIDLYEQMMAMKKMGPLNKVVEMIPGFSQLKLPKELLEVQQDRMELWRHAMDSMSKDELENPEIIDTPRLERITRGSGIEISNIRELIKHYRQSKKMVKMFKGDQGDINKMMKKFKGKIPGM